ncbi:MAG: peptide deformylase [Armatimonadota bacterium]
MIKPRPVLVYGDPRLKQPSEPVTDPAECAPLVRRMREMMEQFGGIGLAAPQIGEHRRVIIWKVGGQEGVLINPELSPGDESEVGVEGCLSIPGMAADVRRAVEVRARGQDLDGRPIEFRAEGLLARVLQHEVDHLDGVLFVDRAQPGTLRPAPMTAVTGI